MVSSPPFTGIGVALVTLFDDSGRWMLVTARPHSTLPRAASSSRDADGSATSSSSSARTSGRRLRDQK